MADVPEGTAPSEESSRVNGNHTGEGNTSDQERDVMDIFKNPVVICVIVVLVLALAVGEIIVYKDRKSK